MQIQSTNNRIYAGPLDAVRKIWSQHGIAGIYKGQVATLWRESTGYGVYFWAYEELMQRHMVKYRVRRDEIAPSYAVLYGATAGYVVITHNSIGCDQSNALVVVGSHLPDW
jgi:solute carrier family 25 carnitine/acylcarnitine transporter 20/29